MIPPTAGPEFGTFRLQHDGDFIAGMKTTVLFEFEVGEKGLHSGGQLRVGVPNTGWEEPVPPQQRYWDELIQNGSRRLAPFHPVNTTAVIEGREGMGVVLTVMERMLTPDEDPAIAYWRWWITATLEGGSLKAGDKIKITYGDRRFGSDGVRVQTFVEDRINVVAFVKHEASASFHQLSGSPLYFDVVSGAPSRANVVAASTYTEKSVPVRVSITDACHCQPRSEHPITLVADGHDMLCKPGKAQEIRVPVSRLSKVNVIERCPNNSATCTARSWGSVNPSVPVASDGLRLFWGDLHAQSEHHVMHSQNKDFRQTGWSKGISCGTVDDCYTYAREVAVLDFIALTDQGACLTDAWEFCQTKVREYHESGKFVTFKGYEAGAPIGHRNVIYVTDEIEPPLDAARFSSFHPKKLYEYYGERNDAIMIPHHVKTWTDWTFHDPKLEPIMEIYSCWGQSENPSLDLWNKGMTPGAGAWAAFERGYRMGLMASSDNHVGMPGRSSPGDRQAHTPYKGGLCAIWAPELTRESLFEALKQRSCYGTTGARIIVRFSIDGKPMGSSMALDGGSNVQATIEVRGTDELRSVEIVSAGKKVLDIPITRGDDRLSATVELPAAQAGGSYYLRISQADDERAWSSPIFFESTENQ